MLYVPRHLSKPGRDKLEYKVLREANSGYVKDVFGIFFFGVEIWRKNTKRYSMAEAPWRFENFEFMDISETLSA